MPNCTDDMVGFCLWTFAPLKPRPLCPPELAPHWRCCFPLHLGLWNTLAPKRKKQSSVCPLRVPHRDVAPQCSVRFNPESRKSRLLPFQTKPLLALKVMEWNCPYRTLSFSLCLGILGIDLWVIDWDKVWHTKNCNVWLRIKIATIVIDLFPFTRQILLGVRYEHYFPYFLGGVSLRHSDTNFMMKTHKVFGKITNNLANVTSLGQAAAKIGIQIQTPFCSTISHCFHQFLFYAHMRGPTHLPKLPASQSGAYAKIFATVLRYFQILPWETIYEPHYDARFNTHCCLLVSTFPSLLLLCLSLSFNELSYPHRAFYLSTGAKELSWTEAL